ncbi:unnamed protein product, partial [Urochloa humidicola]
QLLVLTAADFDAPVRLLQRRRPTNAAAEVSKASAEQGEARIQFRLH